MVKKQPKIANDLFQVMTINGLYELKFFLDTRGRIFWRSPNDSLKPLKALPQKLQIPFMIKFIQNHKLAEKVKSIEDPLVCIEMYIKAKYLMGE